MGSQTWIINHGERRWVAKSVAPHLAKAFASGLKVALLLGQAGVRVGQRFLWVDPAAAHLGLRPWLRPAVGAAT